MNGYRARGRIRLHPLGTDRALGIMARRFPAPAGWQRIAEIDVPLPKEEWRTYAENGEMVRRLFDHETAWLIRQSSSGRLAIFMPDGAVRTVDARKAARALEWLGKELPGDDDVADTE